MSKKIKLIQSDPKKYRASVSSLNDLKELSAFLNKNKDKKVEFVINNNSFKFTSLVSKQKFALGLEQGASIHKAIFKKNNKNTSVSVKKESGLDGLEKELKEKKEELARAYDRIRVFKAVAELRQEAWSDIVEEMSEDRSILKERLNKVEPVIKLIKESSTEGQLQNAYNLVKKSKL
jgi:hypothetical protein